MYQASLRAQLQDDDDNDASQENVGNQRRQTILPGFKRTPNSTNLCIFQPCENMSRRRVPEEIILRMLCRYNIIITENGRVCEEHLQEDIWHLLPLQDNLTEEFTAEQIVHTLTMMKNKISTDFLNFEHYENINANELHTWIGLTHLQFSDVLENVTSLNRHRDKRTIMAAVLAKMRTGDSNARLASIFKMSESSFQRKLKIGLEALLSDFVPSRVGFDHITREEVVQKNLMIPERLFGNPDSPIEERKLITILDGTYIYLQKSSNYFFQRKSYSNHKFRNLLKPFLYVCCDGTIISVEGPYAATTSDAQILNNALNDEDSVLHWFYRHGDVFILDRGFRDAISNLEACGYVAQMPETKHPNETQLTTDQANKSRLVTICRWVVEVINGRFKRDFRLLRHVHSNRALGNMIDYFRIAAALLNSYHVLIDNNVHATDFLEIIHERINMPNSLADLVITNNYNRRRAQFQAMGSDMPEFNNFPRLTEEELTLFALGSYQLKQARSYYGEHVQPDGAFIIELAGDIPVEEVREMAGRDLLVLRGRIQSRHVSSKTYHVYITADPALHGRQAIPYYYCSCPIGKRTIGCCSHTMTIVWYMSFARYAEVIRPPALGLEGVIVSLHEN